MQKALLVLLMAMALFPPNARAGEILINLTNQVWRYDDTGADWTDSGWQNLGFDDRSWSDGRSVFAYETSSTMTLSNNVYPYTNTVLMLGPVTFYFRTQFTFAGDPSTTLLVASNLVDDGYVIYLNGQEVSRYNMPQGMIVSSTLAGSAVSVEGIYVPRELPNAALINGTNVLAVEVHQNVVQSSDVVWGMALHASAGRAPVFLSPASSLTNTVLQGQSIIFRVTADGAPTPVLQWYKDGQVIQGAIGTSFTISTMTATDAGAYWCVASNGLGTAVSPTITINYNDDSFPPVLVSALGNQADLTLVTLIFSEDVVGVLDEYIYYLEDVNEPSNSIFVASVGYGASSNVVLLTLWNARDPATTYNLNIVFHYITDRFDNPLPEPTTVRVRLPVIIREGVGGYVGTQDTELRQFEPDSFLGDRASVASDGSPATHGLLRFERLTSDHVPFGAMILDAKLRLYTTDPSSSQVQVHRMVAPWDEQSTWNSLANGIDQINGVEAGIIDAWLVVTNDESVVEIDVTAAVQSWVNGVTNYGWAFLNTGNDGWSWASSEHAEADRRPALLVSYSYGDPICEIVQQPQSVTVQDSFPFTLSVASRGSDLRYQWFKNDVPISGAIASTYSVPRARPLDSGIYHVEIISDMAKCISDDAVVTVCCPGNPPRLVSAIGNPDQTTITLMFDDTLDPASAQNVGNYEITGGLQVTAATHTGNQVVLTTSSPRAIGMNYLLTVRNVMDDSSPPNVIYPNPTVVTLRQDIRLVAFDAAWRYENGGSDLGTAWRRPQYDDRAWLLGEGLIGLEPSTNTVQALAAQNLTILTALGRTNQLTQEGIITDYFRTIVDVPFFTHGVTFTLRHVTDDGAVFYLNGAEVARFNMPTGLVSASTTASSAAGEGVIRDIMNLTGLACGRNSLAVEVHQNSNTSTDALFGAELIARVPEFLAIGSCNDIKIVLNPDGSVTLSWTPPLGRLIESDRVEGPWRNVPDAMSPWRIFPSGVSRFYGLRVP
jgi:hypothetical protein